MIARRFRLLARRAGVATRVTPLERSRVPRLRHDGLVRLRPAAAGTNQHQNREASPDMRHGILSVTALAAFLILGPAARAQQQQPAPPFTDSPELPDRPAVKRSQELFDVVKAKDTKRLREYVREADRKSVV